MKKLTRQSDNSKWKGQIEFVKFGNSNRAKEVITVPTVGWNCIVNRTIAGESFLTDVIVEVNDNLNGFKTNSNNNFKIGDFE